MSYVSEQIAFNLKDPPFWMQMAAYWVVINAINAMPMPDQNSSKFYQWIHTFLAGLAGNISRAASKKNFPPVETTKIEVTTPIPEVKEERKP